MPTGHFGSKADIIYSLGPTLIKFVTTVHSFYTKRIRINYYLILVCARNYNEKQTTR